MVPLPHPEGYLAIDEQISVTESALVIPAVRIPE
jgi:hypothetical protein